MKINSFLISLSILLSLSFSATVLADEKPDFNRILENKDLGTFVFGKLVDENTNLPLAKTTVISSLGSIESDENGEFFLAVKNDDYLLIKKVGYHEIESRISDLKGKIKLKKIKPNYLYLAPQYLSFNYKNIGFSDKFNELQLSGRFNDAFAINSGINYQNILLNMAYENNTLVINRPKLGDYIPEEKQNYISNVFSLDTGFLLNMIKDRLALYTNIKASFNSINTTNFSKVYTERNPDYLDEDQFRTSVGIGLSTYFRPIKYEPLVLNFNLSYYPFTNIQTDDEKFPKNLNYLDYSVGARYDISSFIFNLTLGGKNIFNQNYSSSTNVVSLGVGYAF